MRYVVVSWKWCHATKTWHPIKTRCGRNKMAAILQITFSNLFSSLVKIVFFLHWSLSIMWTIDGLVYWRINASLGQDELKHSSICSRERHQSDTTWVLTHWGRMTHIYVGKLTIIGSDNGLSPGRRQAIIWTKAGIWLMWPLGTKFNEILIRNKTFSFKKMHLKCRLRNGVHFVSASMC